MPAIQNGTAVVQNGSAIVRHVWNLVVTNYNPLVPGDALTWPGGGAGFFLSHDAANSRIKMYRTAGPAPAAGTVLTGPATGSATVAQFGPGTPGKWNLGVIGGVPVYYHRAGSGKAFVVSSFDATDQLTLLGVYDDPTETDVNYGITQDYTFNYQIPIVQLGDVDALTILSLAITKIDNLLSQFSLGQNYALPTVNPGPSFPNRLWNDGGTVKVSS